MLEACPGAYFWIGTDGETPSKPLHNAGYDFNDALIEHGVALWTALVEKLLPAADATAAAAEGEARLSPIQAFTAAFRRAFMSL
jgi:hypothetical protein